MSVILDMNRDMPVVVQATDLARAGRWIDAMRRYGTNIAGCVTPNAEQTTYGGLPSFSHCGDAVAATGALACVSIAPPRTAADAVLEAAEAGIGLIVSLSAGVPAHDSMRTCRRVADLGSTWIGAASAGVARPTAGIMLGAIPEASLMVGDVAVISTSGALAAEAGYRMREAGVGQSFYVDVGSDRVKGTRLAALAEGLGADRATRAVALIGTASGTEEEEFAASIGTSLHGKPVLAYIAGRSLPSLDTEDGNEPSGAARKEAALAAAGATVYNSLGTLVAALKAVA